ncbi:MAG: DUF4349 domain-containing protein [Bacteroidetes bacterium]|nr:DUF4349 domain-containing protein [Bacteroidota bacterium]
MRTKYLPALLLLIVFASCENQKSAEALLATADSTQLANDITDINSPSRKWNYTADLKCRVNNVLSTMTATERLVRDAGGVVTESRMENETYGTQQQYYTDDSVKQISTYMPVADMELKVPSFCLDTVLRAITAMSDFVDVRNLKQQDMTLAYLSNSLKNDIVKQDIKQQEKKIDSPAVHNEVIANRQAVVNRRIENLQILDDNNYATFAVHIYEPQRMLVTTVANQATINDMPYKTKLLLALKDGAAWFSSLLLALVYLWPLYLLCFAAIVVYKTIKRKKLVLVK